MSNKHIKMIKIVTMEDKKIKRIKRKEKMNEKKNRKKTESLILERNTRMFGDTKPVRHSTRYNGISLDHAKYLHSITCNEESNTYLLTDNEKQYMLLVLLRNLDIPVYKWLKFHFITRGTNKKRIHDIYMNHISHSTYCKCRNLFQSICYYCFTQLTNKKFITPCNKKGWKHNYDEDYEIIANCYSCGNKMVFYFQNKSNIYDKEYLNDINENKIHLCYKCYENEKNINW